MPEATLESEICESCGADVRPGTEFCYNCGKSLGAEAPVAQDQTEESNGSNDNESRASLEDLETALAAEFPPTVEAKSRMESAAAARRRARKVFRKVPETVWEPAPEGLGRLYLLVAILIFIAAAAVVMVTVIWK